MKVYFSLHRLELFKRDERNKKLMKNKNLKGCLKFKDLPDVIIIKKFQCRRQMGRMPKLEAHKSKIIRKTPGK